MLTAAMVLRRQLAHCLSLLLLPLAFANPLADHPLAARNPALAPDPTLHARQASTSASIVPTPASIPGYSYLGCYEDGSRHILTVTSAFDSAMTPQLCRNLCAVARCGVFGVKDAFNCVCGQKLEAFAVNADAGECTDPCKGREGDLCGGRSRANVYSATAGLDDIAGEFRWSLSLARPNGSLWEG